MLIAGTDSRHSNNYICFFPVLSALDRNDGNYGYGTDRAYLDGEYFTTTLSDKEYVGRVMSILLMCGATASLGTFFAGIITQFVGAPIAVGACGILMVLSTVVCLAILPGLER